jgi:hypothetical protein
MKASLKMIATGLLGCAALLAGSSAYADNDIEACKAGYKVLLMTPGECRGYLRELRAAQARADHMAVLDLQEWHTELLIERSQACPCRQESDAMRNARVIGPSQSQLAYSGKY